MTDEQALGDEYHKGQREALQASINLLTRLWLEYKQTDEEGLHPQHRRARRSTANGIHMALDAVSYMLPQRGLPTRHVNINGRIKAELYPQDRDHRQFYFNPKAQQVKKLAKKQKAALELAREDVGDAQA